MQLFISVDSNPSNPGDKVIIYTRYPKPGSIGNRPSSVRTKLPGLIQGESRDHEPSTYPSSRPASHADFLPPMATGCALENISMHNSRLPAKLL